MTVCIQAIVTYVSRLSHCGSNFHPSKADAPAVASEPKATVQNMSYFAGISRRNVLIGTLVHGLGIVALTQDPGGTSSLGDAPVARQTSSPRPASSPAQEPYRPVRYASLEKAKAALGAPADATYKVWDYPAGTMLEEVFMALPANTILVLPERNEPYLIDSADGFRAAGISWIAGKDGKQIPIKGTYRGKTARNWFGMTRTRRGIIGMGPGAVIELSPSTFTQEPQIYPGHVTDKGNEMTGNAYKLIEVDEDNGFMANFTLRGRDLGGMAYNGIVFNKAGVVRNVFLDAANRGFSAAPNGETGAIAFNNSSYLVENVEINCRDKNGTRVSTSPLMVNKSTGGVVKDSYFHDSYAGSATIWGSTGLHKFVNVRSEYLGAGVNLEANVNLTFSWEGGTNFIAYKTNTPSGDQNYRGNTGLHVNLRSPETSTKVSLKNVKLDAGPLPGSLSVQIFKATATAPQKQLNSDITFADDAGPLPVKVYA